MEETPFSMKEEHLQSDTGNLIKSEDEMQYEDKDQVPTNSDNTTTLKGWSTLSSSDGARNNGWSVRSNSGWGSTSNTSSNNNKSWKEYVMENSMDCTTQEEKNDKPFAMIIDSQAVHEKSSFFDIECLKDRPFMPKNLGVPKNVIPSWYAKRYKGKERIHVDDSECFFTWSNNDKAHVLQFTSAFCCPITGEIFLSGRWGDKSSYFVKSEMALTPNSIDNASEEMIGVIWYNKKKLAEHAAAARALDNLSFREGNCIQTMSYNLCLESPYKSEEGKSLLPSSIPEKLASQIVKIQSKIEMKQAKIKQEAETKMSSGESNMVEGGQETQIEIDAELELGEILMDENGEEVRLKTKNPMKELFILYAKARMGQLSRKHSFFTNSRGPPNSKEFTSIFRDPDSGEFFASGRWGEKNSYVVNEEKLKGNENDTNNAGNAQVVWYKKKKIAENGAAARAFDCFALRAGGKQDTRFCIEKPYNSPTDAPPMPSSITDLRV